MDDRVILLLLFPLGGALLCLASRLLRSPWPARLISLLALLAWGFVTAGLLGPVLSGAVLEYSLSGWREPVGITLTVDRVGLLATCLAVVVSVLSLLFSFAQREDPVFHFAFLMLLVGMQGVILTGDLFNMFVFFEILSIATFVLVAHTGTADAHRASFDYLMVSSLGMALFLLGTFLVYQDVGSFAMADVRAATPAAGSRSLLLGVVSMSVGVGIKAALVPLHFWLPDAHGQAPHPVSAVLSGVMLKVSLLAFVRIQSLAAGAPPRAVMLWAGAAAALLGVVGALAQRDPKRLLGYHSVSQMGYIVAAWAVGSAAGSAAALGHALSHGLFKATLFLTVGAAVHHGARNVGRASGLSAGARAALLPPFAVGALAICGVPPLNGFVSKGMIAEALKGEPAYWLLRVAAAGTFASLMKLSLLFLRDGRRSAEARPEPLRAAMVVPCWLLASLCVATGSVRCVRVDTVALSAPTLRWSWHAVLDALLPLPAGAALFALVRSRAAKRLLEGLGALDPGLEGSLVFVLAAFCALALAAWLPAGLLGLPW